MSNLDNNTDYIVTGVIETLVLESIYTTWDMIYTPVLEITVGHWPFLTNFNIWLTTIHFGGPILPYIFNGMTINNL